MKKMEGFNNYFGMGGPELPTKLKYMVLGAAFGLFLLIYLWQNL